MDKSRFARLLSIVVILAFLAAGCQSAPQPAPTAAASKPADTAAPVPTQPSAPTAAPAAPAAAQPVVVTVATNYEIRNVDPSLATFDDLTQGPMDNFYDSLIILRGDPAEAKPLLAERWERSDDLKTWTFYLDKRAVFHDGTPVTAEAVKFSWDRMLDLQAGMSFLWKGLADKDSLAVVDDHTVRFTLKEPNLPFELNLKFLKILNPAQVRAHKQDGKFGAEGDYGQAWLVDHEAGSGPFTIDKWEPGSEYVYAAVPNYWYGWPNGKHVDKVVHRVTRELRSRMLVMQSGEADFTLITDAIEQDRKELAQNPQLVISDTPAYLEWMMMLNNQRGPTADVNVRKAIAHVFDYEGFLPACAGCSLVESPLPKGSLYFEGQPVPTFDIAKAKEFLAKSQYPNGGFKLDVIYSGTFELSKQAVLILLEGLKDLNIEANLVPKTWSEMTAACGSLDTAPDVWVGGFSSWIADPDLYLKSAYHSKNWGQWSACHYYKNEKTDALIDAGGREGDPAKRAAIYAEAQQLINGDTPAVWTAQGSRPSVYNTRLNGMETGLGSFAPSEPYWMDIYVDGQ